MQLLNMQIVCIIWNKLYEYYIQFITLQRALELFHWN